ncbi:MAG: outer membrane protein assembly factor BamD [Desulfobacterota bacterium]|nr:outer membrane protein assembly factor BamD [Thermodesulfobacteriota bacterium]
MKKLVFILMFAFFFSYCAGKQTKPTRLANDLYVEGVNLMKQKKYDRAIRNFSQIRENYPFDPVAPYALIKMADCYFMKKDYMAASRLYEDFASSFPNDENIPYVLLKCGECYEKLSLSFERDQEYTYKALEKYTILLSRFPHLHYAKEAENRKKLLEEKLAERELYVAEFYFRTHEYNACILRLEYLLKHYPNSKRIDKALFLLSKAHFELGNTEKSEYYRARLMEEYPKSPYAAQSKSQRGGLKGSKNKEVNPKGEGKERVLPEEIRKEERNPTEKFTFFDPKKGVEVFAKRMEGFEKERRVFFEGNVLLRQEDLTILCDTLEAYLSEDRKEIEKVFAKGNVRIIKGQRTATCNEAEFDSKGATIVLKGEVLVISGPDRLKGDVIVYYMNEDRILVKGKKDKKARMIIFPK